MPNNEKNSGIGAPARIPLCGPMQGPWAILPDALEGLVAQYAREAATQRTESPTDRSRVAQPYPQQGKTAIIHIIGPIQKYRTWMTYWLGGAVSSEVAAAITSAAESPAIRNILLVLDSPGGQVAGTEALTESVRRAAQVKPVTAFASDLAASGAYWVAAQATRIVANPTALVGGVGTYAAVADFSGLFEKSGVKMHIIRAGEFKGAGEMGTPINEKQIAEFQRVIDALNREFLKGVSVGRRLPMDRVRNLADGRVHIASEARRLGLVDEVAQLADVLAEMTAATPEELATQATIKSAAIEQKQREARAAELGYYRRVRGRKVPLTAAELDEMGIKF